MGTEKRGMSQEDVEQRRGETQQLSWERTRAHQGPGAKRRGQTEGMPKPFCPPCRELKKGHVPLPRNPSHWKLMLMFRDDREKFICKTYIH